MPDAPPLVTAADTVTPWYADKAFLAVIVHLLAMVVLALAHVQVNEQTITAVAVLVGTYVVAHKVKSGKALVALIEAQAKAAFIQGPEPTLEDVSKQLDAAVPGAAAAKTLLVLVGLSLLMPGLARADGPPAPPEGHHHVVLQAGQPAPADGVFADQAMARYDADRIRWFEAYATACQEIIDEQVAPQKLYPWLYGGGAGVVVGVLVGLVVHQYAVTHH